MISREELNKYLREQIVDIVEGSDVFIECCDRTMDDIVTEEKEEEKLANLISEELDKIVEELKKFLL